MSDPLLDSPAGDGTELAGPVATAGAFAAGTGLTVTAEQADHAVTPRRRREFLHYALRNRKLMFGLSLEMLFVLGAIAGPIISPHNPTDYFFPRQAPSLRHWFGTDYFGHDVFAQLVIGLRASYLVGALGALCAAVIGMLLGFAAG